MAGVILVMFLLFVVVAFFYVIENNPNNKTTKSKTESEGGGILSDKNQNDSISILREEAIALVNILYNQSLLSLKQTTEKRDEINKIDEQDSLNNIIKDLKQKVEQFAKKYTEKKVQVATQKKNISKDQFISITILSILFHIILFIVTFYIAVEVDINQGYSWKGSPFDWEDTWWVWVIYSIFIFLIEKKLLTIRKRSKHFNNNVFRVLFYLSTFSTIAGSVVYFMTINVQLFSRVGRSTRDGFLLQAFFFCYILPTIFWIVYYFTIKNNEAFKSFLDKKKQKRSKESKVLKRGQAIKELKEAKELLDLGILSKEEYDELSKKLKPFILGTKQ